MRRRAILVRQIFAPLMLVFMLGIFCTPYTFFDEAREYLADAESEMVHYYLVPLPDNGEACAETPSLVFMLTSFRLNIPPSPVLALPAPISSFYHPPE